MSKSKRKGGKIDNEIKVYALDQFHMGKRLCDISKEIGYLDQTIKYWVDNAETILSNANGNFGRRTTHALKLEAIRMHDEEHANVDTIARCCDISKSLVRYYVKNRERILAQTEPPSSGSEEPLTKRATNNAEEHMIKQAAISTEEPHVTTFITNSFLQQPFLPSVTPEPHLEDTSPLQDTVYLTQGLVSPPQSPPMSFSPQEVVYTDLVRDLRNCEQVVLDLQEFITLGRRMVNNAVNCLSQFRDTLDNYDIRKKAKRELI